MNVEKFFSTRITPSENVAAFNRKRRQMKKKEERSQTLNNLPSTNSDFWWFEREKFIEFPMCWA